MNRISPAGRYFGRWARPAQAAIIDWQASAEEISSLVRALDFGAQANPLTSPKLFLGDRVIAFRQAVPSDQPSESVPGTIVRVDSDRLLVATRTVDIVLSGLTELDGSAFHFQDVARKYDLVVGSLLPSPSPAAIAQFVAVSGKAERSEEAWRGDLASLTFPDVDVAAAAGVRRRNPRPSHPTCSTPLPVTQKSMRRLPPSQCSPPVARASRPWTSCIATRRRCPSAADMLGAFATDVPLRIT